MSNYSIQIALDTQILAYLVDKTFPTLNHFVSLLCDSSNVELICSRFVTYEFIGIRKHEHYLRAIHSSSNSKGGVMNFSSALKYKSGWSSPELKYDDTYTAIKAVVENDLKIINDDFGINYLDFEIRDNLWKPLNDLVLCSKISKEDSLVLLSSLWYQNENADKHLIFLTNDNEFYNSLCGNKKQRMDAIDDVFKEHDLFFPFTFKIDNIELQDKSTLNLLETYTATEIEEFTKKFIFEAIKNKYNKRCLGKVVPCSKNMWGKLLCFELLRDELNEKQFISIITLDGKIYNHDVPLEAFHNVNIGQIQNYPYVPDGKANSKIISVDFRNSNGEYLEEALYSRIASTGNAIFIHEDTDI